MTDVLLLNASFVPLRVIPRRRAMSLWLRGRVDAATDNILTLHGITHSVEVPTVLRLRRYVNVPRRGAKWSRHAVLRRDRYRCIYCGLQAGDSRGSRKLTRRDFTLDHIMPRSRGGRNTWGNTASACAKCNHRKGNRTPHEAGMKMLWEPKIPRVDYLVASGDLPDSWKIYLEI